MAYEVNFDGIVGPTHNYSGLSYGNIASMDNKSMESNPQEAALQGLDKMLQLMHMGIRQAVLPPHERPHLPSLRALGYSGSDAEILHRVQKETPELLSACSSAAAMWTANAATVSPSADTADQRVHFTAANLCSKFHRAIESKTTYEILKKIFSDQNYFVHHIPLPPSSYFGDEGAANHSRFCKDYVENGIEFFVYGRHAFHNEKNESKRFPSRQTLEASQAIARRHKLLPEYILFAQQHPDVIDAGAFHNDVISVGNKNLFFYHEKAFVNTPQIISHLNDKFLNCCGENLLFIEVKDSEISVKEAVDSYLFNSQIISINNHEMVLIAPSECLQIPSVKNFLERLPKIPNQPIRKVHTFNLHQSMRNGGGPACLRLRIVLTDKEIEQMNQKVLLTENLYHLLSQWIKKHYRTRLRPEELSDPYLLEESRRALDELTDILNLGSIYEFQK